MIIYNALEAVIFQIYRLSSSKMSNTFLNCSYTHTLLTALLEKIMIKYFSFFFSPQKALGVSSQNDRSTIKKKIKDIRKTQEKLEKQKEKFQRKEREVRKTGRVVTSLESSC